jgi:hypothetical protein
MTLERRLRQLEASLKCQDTKYEPDISTDGIIRKLGLDPNIVRDTAKANGQSLAEVAAGELGMSYEDFQKALKLRARGKNAS